MLNELFKIALEIYQSGKHLEFPKSSTSGHYITVGQLKEMGYTNIDSFLRNCSDGHSVIFFDVDYMERYPSGYPILATCECDKFTVK